MTKTTQATERECEIINAVFFAIGGQCKFWIDTGDEATNARNKGFNEGLRGAADAVVATLTEMGFEIERYREDDEP
jgi:hypothetical protein